MTREGVYIGPYPTRDEANAALKQLISLIEDVTDPKVAEAFVREFARRTRESVGSKAIS
jgi:hypothetical protein